MLSPEVKKTVQELNPFDKALLIEFLFESLNMNEDKNNLESWVAESEERLAAVEEGRLGVTDYSDIKAKYL